MELPHLGKQCSDSSCKQLDFLPIKCDACSRIFCGEHFKYSSHNCPQAYKKDVQVPVCPLCNKPVPVAKGEIPDIRVGQHIDSDCQSGVNQKKIYTNACFMKGCKKKEMMQLRCDACKENFCLRHRHPEDHKCLGKEQISIRARDAALSRLQQIKDTKAFGTGKLNSYQGKMSEDEALARALQMSLSDGNIPSGAPCASDVEKEKRKQQEERDRMLAISMARSNDVQVGPSGSNSSNKDRCFLS